jgi:transposase-like protein
MVQSSNLFRNKDKVAALKMIKKAMRRRGRPKAIVTDGLRAYGAALKGIGAVDRQGLDGQPPARRVPSTGRPLATADLIKDLECVLGRPIARRDAGRTASAMADQTMLLL